jgi:predicted dehydrogenase
MRAAIVGLGQIGLFADLTLNSAEHLYSHARALSLHPDFKLVGAADAFAENRRAFSAHYAIPAVASISELASFEPELLVIATPTAGHEQHIEEALAKLRPRAILCEKPLSYSLTSARAMVEACEKAGISLYVNYIRRADPAVIEVRQRLLDGRIASPVKGVAWYSKGLYNNGSHFIDLLQYWLGPVQQNSLLKAGRKVGNDVEPDFRLVFDQGEVSFLAAREEDFSHYTVELVARNGRLRYDLGGEKVWWQAAIPSCVSPGYTVLDALPRMLPGELNRIQWHIAQQLAQALTGMDNSLCTGREALALIETIDSISMQNEQSI